MDVQELVEHVARRSGTTPRKRNYTRELKAEQAKGRVVVASMLPYEGVPVEYEPRRKGDPQPWVQTDRHGCEWRYSGRYCHAVDACGKKVLVFKTGRFTTCAKPKGHDKAHAA